MKADFDVSIHSLDDLKIFIQKNLSEFTRQKQVLLLEGEMGSGKTEFVKQLVVALSQQYTDEEELATSPSFALHNTYHVAHFTIEHLDLYRLNSEEELQSIGFWDFFQNENAIVIIEWSDKIASSRLPLSWQKIQFNFSMKGDCERLIRVTQLA